MFHLHLHTSPGQENEKNNIKKRKRDIDRVSHLGMSSRSIMNDGKEEPTRRATWILKYKK